MGEVQDFVNSVNSGATKTATNTYNSAWTMVSDGTNQLDAASGAVTTTALMILVSGATTSLLFIL